MLSTSPNSSGSKLEQAVTQVGLIIMFVSMSSQWIILLIHDPNSIVPSSLIYVFVGGG
jgi:hypothetical protein